MIKLKDVSLKYLFFITFIIISVLANFTIKNYLNFKLELIVLLLIFIFGIIALKVNEKQNNLHKTIFLIIILFGLLTSFLVPFGTPDDEYEHFPRAEITSNGILFPEYVNNSFISIESVFDITNSGIERDSDFNILNVKNGTIFTNDKVLSPINYSDHYFHSVFAQNPFWGYLAPAIGINIAKILNLNAIWMLWLGRMCNILLYATIVSLSIKKTPILKIPMAVVSCMPIAIFYASSVSIDALINSLSLYIISYFFYMYKSHINSISQKEIIKFVILVCILGTCKVTLFAFILLILFVPIGNFKNKKYYVYGIFSIILVSIIALLWTNNYANIGFQQSYRHNFWIERNVNSTNQLNYMLNHKKEALFSIAHIFDTFDINLNFNSLNLSFNSFNNVYLLFLGAILLFYPHERFNSQSRIGCSLILLIIYFGTYFVLLLTWTPIGNLNQISGVLPRYFIPLFVLIPFIFGFNFSLEDTAEMDKNILVIVIGFLASMIISILGFYY